MPVVLQSSDLWGIFLRLVALYYPLKIFFRLSWAGTTPHTEVVASSSAFGTALSMLPTSEESNHPRRKGEYTLDAKEYVYELKNRTVLQWSQSALHTFSYVTQKFSLSGPYLDSFPIPPAAHTVQKGRFSFYKFHFFLLQYLEEDYSHVTIFDFFRSTCKFSATYSY